MTAVADFKSLRNQQVNDAESLLDLRQNMLFVDVDVVKTLNVSVNFVQTCDILLQSAQQLAILFHNKLFETWSVSSSLGKQVSVSLSSMTRKIHSNSPR